MSSMNRLTVFRRTIILTLLACSQAATGGEVRLMTTSDVTPNAAKTRDGYQRDFSPGFLADRLGITQKSTKLAGTFLRDKDGDKIAKVLDFVLDLPSGRIVCAVVSAESGIVAIPPGSFKTADECGAMLNIVKPNLSDAPHASAGDLTSVFASLPQSFAYFSQPLTWKEKSAQTCLAGSLTGFRVKNPAGDQLGTVVNLMVDVPTGRLIYAVISFAGGAADLYAVPATALRLTSERTALVLNANASTIAGLAHSDGFFWANLGDVNWGIANYKTFGQEAEFDASAKGTDAGREEVRAKVEATPAIAQADPKCNVDLQRDVVMAMMHDDVNNSLVYKNVKIIADGGVVILTGRVKNEKQHTKLIAIVTGVVGAANIKDKLDVR